MKQRFLLLLFIMALLAPKGVWADKHANTMPKKTSASTTLDQKRLTTIALDDSKRGLSQGELTYDDQGRVIQYHWYNNTREVTYYYSYEGDNITITDTYDEEDKYEITNGKITKSSYFFDEFETPVITYDNNGRMIRVESSDDNYGEYTWNGDNLSGWISYYEGELDEMTSYTYNQISSHPIIHVLFGFGVEGGFYIDDIWERVALYPYFGQLPMNLFESVSYTDSPDKGKFTHFWNYSYETDSNGDIVRVVIEETGSQIRTLIITLGWEGSSEPINPPVSNEFTIGDLTYTMQNDGNSVSVAAASTSISGEVVIPTMVWNGGDMYSVTKIAEGGFVDCVSLTSITIPDGVTSIGDRAFDGCTGLTDVTCMAESVPSTSSSAFTDSYIEHATLHVPKTAIDAYKTTAPWSNFGKFVALTGDTPDNTNQYDPDGFVPAPNWGGKKLISMTKIYKNGDQDRAEFGYDDADRLSKYSYDNGWISYNLSYSGNQMNIKANTRDFSYIISDGRMVSGRIGMEDQEDLEVLAEYNSEGCFQKVSRSNNKMNMYAIGEWSGEELISLTDYYVRNGGAANVNSHVEFSYSQQQAPFFLQALMICSDFGAPIAFNNIGVALGQCLYMGKVPPSLISSATITKSGKTTQYNYNYETDSKGNITKFTVGELTYLLEWEETDNPPVNNEFTIGDLTYTKLDDGESVFVAAANNEISGEIVIPTMVRNGGDMYSVTEIAEGGFADCAWLTAITIPDGLTTIGDNAFQNCSGLMQLTVNQEEPPTVSASAFDGVDKTKCILRVPEGCGEKYRNAPGWQDFWLIAAEGDIIVEGITYAINDEGTATIVSANHSADGKYVVPSSVTIDGVEYIVTEIGANAFSGCTEMTAVTIPETIVALGDHAFADCTNLMEIYVEGKKPAGMKNAFARILVRGIMRRSVSQFEGIDFEKCVLYVPYGSEEAYREAEGWSQFKNIVGVHSEKDPAATITAKDCSREYGEANPTFEFTAEGAALDGEPEISCEATVTSAVGAYNIVVSKGSVKNYNDTYVNGTLTITKAPLTVKVKNYTMKQGGTMPTFEVDYQGFKNSETEAVLTKLPTVTCEATSDSELGEYEITVSGAEAENYEMVYVKGTLTITQADPVVVTAKSYSRQYGGKNPNYDYYYEGAKLNGKPEITCEATATTPVGTYPIVIKKGSVTNYNDSYVNGTLTITKAPLIVQVGSVTRYQGEENPEFTLSYSGFKNDETESVLIKKPVVTTTATKDSPAGEYEIVVSGGEAQNYEFEYINAKLTVKVPTGIEEVTQAGTFDVYDVKGRKIRSQVTTMKGLKKGVYIIRGKKVVMR